MKNSYSKVFLLVSVIGATSSLLFAQATFSTASPANPATAASTRSVATASYKIDASQSRFMVRAFAGGFLSAFAHDHNIAIRDFSGEAQFAYGTVEPASLQLKIKSASLAVTDKVSATDREKIEGTMRDEVLEVGKYPEIVFRSTSVSATKTGDGQYQAKIAGDLTLHGVTRPLTITAQLEFGDAVLRARGGFSLKQSSYEIKPVSVAGGTVKVKDELRFSFEIVAKP
jgi:polyisoprenoid-binding protein YceI